jgi:periplasmic protein TonB
MEQKVTEQGVEPVLPRLDQRFFGWMLIASLLLHVVLTGVTLLPGRRHGVSPGPVFLDLRLSAPVADLPPPAQRPAVPLPPETTPPAKVAEPAPASELDKLRQQVANSLTQPETIQNASIGLGMMNGYFGSYADGETLRDDIREYYFALMRKVNEAWWVSAGVAPGWVQEAQVSLVIGRDGRLVDKQLVQSSGNRAYDQALLASLERAQPLPPLPDSFRDDFFAAPLRFIPPLGLIVKGRR